MGRMRDGLLCRSIASEQRVTRCGRPQRLRCAADFSIAPRWPVHNHALALQNALQFQDGLCKHTGCQLCGESAIGGMNLHAQRTALPRSWGAR